ncbi:hypothetical protein HG535_0A06840 [Zygotorulaspora mrakii]|uniref:Uncharacterized protein n=1 Tax=Zygotorulaspora mrakii TaxID=42260 RepID=A0A7H9AYT8_ZYGMR|nr:uncharacterized protein HG535_0A06840 [Zygotorulaspora mrakii]QLG70742.1 hypothetical protein HG535_0A06840 [Zygotorulaspora mrakii]
MSVVNYEEEELFPLSFAYTHTDARMSSVSRSVDEYANSVDMLPPPLLAESPSGLELSDTELDDEMTYQQQLVGSPLLYTSERLASSPEQYNKHGFLIRPPIEQVTVPITKGVDMDSGTSDTGDEFANAAQQNYRLWLKSF